MQESVEAKSIVNSRKISRRRFVRGAVAATIIGGGGLGEAVFERERLVATRTDVALPHWPKEANGLRIGQLSDFHADYDQAVARTAHAAYLLMKEQPDLVFVTGDYVSSHLTRRFLAPTISALKPLIKAPRGAFVIMGNHDHWGNNAQKASSLFAELGFTVLNNNSAPIVGVPGAYLIGLDDAWCGMMDVDKALHRVPKNAHKIVALHEPDFADSIGEGGFDLQISGHSHGGQVRIPGLPVLHVPAYAKKYPEGLQQAKHHLVYTTRGVGMVGPQFRAFCPPEVTILTIRSR
jgi:predicted MPP superfamily phosphohydrolase